MDSSDLPLDIDVSWRMRDQEARLLAGLLRSSRLTLLYGNSGQTRSELLKFGVLPLLGRRAEDSNDGHQRRQAAFVLSLPDRRECAAGGPTVDAERVVMLDTGSGALVAALQVAILSTLPLDAVMRAGNEKLTDMLACLCDRLDARIVVILDRFERFWAVGSSESDVDDFVDQFSQVINRADLRVNFLLSIDQEFERRLDIFRIRIPGFDDSTLRLHDWTDTEPKNTVPMLVDAMDAPTGPPGLALPVLLETVTESAFAPAPGPVAASSSAGRTSGGRTAPGGRRKRVPRVPVVKPPPIGTEGVYAFIESTLTQTADASEPWHDAVIVPPAERACPNAPRAPAGDPVTTPTAAGTPAWWTSSDVTGNRSGGVPRLVEPPSPIDQWLDAGISWCRRLLRIG